ncbi:unnamed protein product [Toxocara canis]|uniref:DnaJ homolog subfamily C member 10 n=1 Tax=Toxocara canis TaxID=6265 RepID=A0A183TWF0_TOXCA|nr:unnamed protein product [Toxocara canis]
MRCITIWALLALTFLPWLTAQEDFYEMLGVSRDADNRAIRRAFKKIALLKHPDKNPNDKNAHAEFVRLNRAYEVLMDEDLRKKYDQFGEKGLSDDFHDGHQYQSWQFYRDNFGIYDDDAEIVTLSRADFEQEVIESGEIWFVNFYSTFCSHCHHLAPTWRNFAREMEGVLRIGAVNCAEDPMLCQSQNVMGYPSLVLYPEEKNRFRKARLAGKIATMSPWQNNSFFSLHVVPFIGSRKATYMTGLFYTGYRELGELLEFAMSHILVEVHQLSKSNVRDLSIESNQYASQGWVVDFCDDRDNCLSTISRRKLAAMLEDIANVATVNCFEGPAKDELCFDLERTQGVAYFPPGNISREYAKEIASLDPKQISTSVLQFLPELESLTTKELEKIYEAESRPHSVLVHFILSSSASNDNELELKTLPAKVSGIAKVYVAECSKSHSLCESLGVGQLSKWVMFKQMGGYEIYYGKKSSMHNIVAFARESYQSPMVTLSAKSYEEAISSQKNWLIDYFAPWCPPCLRLLHELRKLHNFVDNIHIGTVDCVQHASICEQAAVSSYPTTVYYANGRAHTNVGFHGVRAVAQFIEDLRSPSVQELSEADFNNLVSGRSEGTIWLVDFFAPWCGPCQELAPEFRRLARSVHQRSQAVQFGTVDCDAYRQLCTGNGINSYPTIRLFPSDLSQMSIDYPVNWWRDHDSMQRWLSEFLPSKVTKMANDFYSKVLDDNEPWLVDFFAPWCGHCIQFAPVFEQVAEVLDGRVKLAKVDCDQWPGVCQSANIRAYPTVRLYTGVREGIRQSAAGIAVNSQNVNTIVQIVGAKLEEAKKRVKTEL